MQAQLPTHLQKLADRLTKEGITFTTKKKVVAGMDYEVLEFTSDDVFNS